MGLQKNWIEMSKISTLATAVTQIKGLEMT